MPTKAAANIRAQVKSGTPGNYHAANRSGAQSKIAKAPK
jgi:hypothetical protein